MEGITRSSVPAFNTPTRIEALQSQLAEKENATPNLVVKPTAADAAADTPETHAETPEAVWTPSKQSGANSSYDSTNSNKSADTSNVHVRRLEDQLHSPPSSSEVQSPTPSNANVKVAQTPASRNKAAVSSPSQAETLRSRPTDVPKDDMQSTDAIPSPLARETPMTPDKASPLASTYAYTPQDVANDSTPPMTGAIQHHDDAGDDAGDDDSFGTAASPSQGLDDSAFGVEDMSNLPTPKRQNRVPSSSNLMNNSLSPISAALMDDSTHTMSSHLSPQVLLGNGSSPEMRARTPMDNSMMVMPREELEPMADLDDEALPSPIQARTSPMAAATPSTNSDLSPSVDDAKSKHCSAYARTHLKPNALFASSMAARMRLDDDVDEANIDYEEEDVSIVASSVSSVPFDCVEDSKTAPMPPAHNENAEGDEDEGEEHTQTQAPVQTQKPTTPEPHAKQDLQSEMEDGHIPPLVFDLPSSSLTAIDDDDLVSEAGFVDSEHQEDATAATADDEAAPRFKNVKTMMSLPSITQIASMGWMKRSLGQLGMNKKNKSSGKTKRGKSSKKFYQMQTDDNDDYDDDQNSLPFDGEDVSLNDGLDPPAVFPSVPYQTSHSFRISEDDREHQSYTSDVQDDVDVNESGDSQSSSWSYSKWLNRGGIAQAKIGEGPSMTLELAPMVRQSASASASAPGAGNSFDEEAMLIEAHLNDKSSAHGVAAGAEIGQSMDEMFPSDENHDGSHVPSFENVDATKNKRLRRMIAMFICLAVAIVGVLSSVVVLQMRRSNISNNNSNEGTDSLSDASPDVSDSDDEPTIDDKDAVATTAATTTATAPTTSTGADSPTQSPTDAAYDATTQTPAPSASQGPPATIPTQAPTIDLSGSQVSSAQNCFDALRLPSLGTVTGAVTRNINGATDSTHNTVFAETCGAFSSSIGAAATGDASEGAWYVFTPTEDIAMKADTCGGVLGSGTNFDTELTVLAASDITMTLPPPELGDDMVCDEANTQFTCITFNDQHRSCLQGGSLVEWYAQAGVSYYIHVNGYQRATGNFQLTLSTVETHHTVCKTAEKMILDSTEYGTTRLSPLQSSGFTIVEPCGGGDEGENEAPEDIAALLPTSRGTWYEIMGIDDYMVADVFFERYIRRSVDYGTVSIFAGEDCSQLKCMNAVTAGPSSRGHATAWWLAQPAVRYYVLVTTPSQLQNKNDGRKLAEISHDVPAFDFQLTVGDSQLSRPHGIPDNNYCSTAQDLEDEMTLEATTQGATIDATVQMCTTTTAAEYSTSPGVWYRMQNAASDELWTLTTTTSDQGCRFDSRIFVYENDCPSLRCAKHVSPSITMNCNESVSFTTKKGTMYHILVTGYGTRSGDFTLTATKQAGNDQ